MPLCVTHSKLILRTNREKFELQVTDISGFKSFLSSQVSFNVFVFLKALSGGESNDKIRNTSLQVKQPNLCSTRLPTYPHIKFNILVSDSLDVEADCGDGVDALAQLELVEDRSLARGVKPQHQDPHLLVPEHLGENLPHSESRDEGAG